MNVGKTSRNLVKIRPYREYIRNISGKHESEPLSATPNPKKIIHDMVGPVDPASNLPRFVLRHCTNETKLEKVFREKRIEIHDWNQTFWSRHNTNFFQEKEEYLKKNLPADQHTLTADEMSVFYKAFLDKNWRTHVQYNKQWYKKNIQLLLLAIQVKLERFTGRRLSG